MKIPASETACKFSLCQAMQKAGWLMLNTENLKSGGLPDLYFAKEGHSVWVEGKRVTVREAFNLMVGTKRTKQSRTIEKLRHHCIEAVYAIWLTDAKEANFRVCKPNKSIFEIPWSPVSAVTYLEDFVFGRP